MFSKSFIPWRACAVASVCLGLTLAAQGQTASAPITLRQALDAAWALSPHARAAPSRQAELQARENASQSLMAGTPSITLAHRTDQFNGNGGLREYEVELSMPLWSSGVRASTQRQIATERAAFGPQQALARLKLVGELRELAAGLVLAHAERDLATRRRYEATRLAQDVERRVKAGDTARVDALQAQAGVQQAAGVLAQADGALLRLQGQWKSLTGLTDASAMDEPVSQTADLSALNASHPALQAALTQVDSAQARLTLMQADQRDAMELGVGLSQERAAFGANPDTSLRFALRIPLGGENRNAPRTAAARAELDAAQAQADAVTRQVQADLAIAIAALDVAQRQATLAGERSRLTTEVQVLIAKSHQLGESDLPTRLRADNEKFDADLSLARARIEVQRAMAQLNQALGLLP